MAKFNAGYIDSIIQVRVKISTKMSEFTNKFINKFHQPKLNKFARFYNFHFHLNYRIDTLDFLPNTFAYFSWKHEMR